MPTDFEWDDAKAVTNIHKHGIPFIEAKAVFLDPECLVMNTHRESDGEDREKVIGRIGDRLFTVVFVMRAGVCRFISARRANASKERFFGDRSIHA